MNQPPFLGKDRLSTLVTVLFAKTEFRLLTNQIEEVQSGDEIGGSKEQHNIVTRRITRDFTRFQYIPLVFCQLYLSNQHSLVK